MSISIRRSIPAFFIAVVLVPCLEGTTLTLTSQSAGQYNYAIQLGPNQGLVFTAGDQIIIDGLSGVIGATLLSGLTTFFGNPATTPTSVTITDDNAIVFDPVPGGVTIPAFSVSSSVITTGPVRYQIQTANDGTLSGAVLGPVSVPEPTTLLLVGASMFGLALITKLVPLPSP